MSRWMPSNCNCCFEFRMSEDGVREIFVSLVSRCREHKDLKISDERLYVICKTGQIEQSLKRYEDKTPEEIAQMRKDFYTIQGFSDEL